MNRGSHRRLQRIAEGDVASMRPRFMNRGSTACMSGTSAMRCCFNEAPIHESGKSALRGKNLPEEWWLQ